MLPGIRLFITLKREEERMDVESAGAVNSGYIQPEPQAEPDASVPRSPVPVIETPPAPLSDEQGRNIDLFA